MSDLVRSEHWRKAEIDMAFLSAFLTGSRAYGEPTEESDVDLVVLMNADEETALRAALGVGGGPIRCGNLNLIVCCSDTQFAVWKCGTQALKKTYPLGVPSRDVAVQYFTELFDAVGEMKFSVGPSGEP